MERASSVVGKETMIRDWDALLNEIADWADKTFGSRPGSIAKTKHMKEEVEELAEAILSRNKDDIGEELADVFIIGAHIQKVEAVDLYEAIRRKFEELKQREWLPPDEEGIIRHRKSPRLQK